MDQFSSSSFASRPTSDSGKRSDSSAPDSTDAPFTVTAPRVELPRGGGALRGIGETFAANPVTGTGSMTVPIAVSAGRAGFGPRFSLSYDSGSGNGPFGFGWSLTLPQITRKTDKGLPQYDDAAESDVFMLSGADDLVPVLNADASRFEDRTAEPGYVIHRYRPRIEGLFARVERWTRASDGDVHWRTISRDNVLTIYGKDAGARVSDPADATRIFSWLLCETRDDRGNVALYDYKPEDGIGVNLAAAHQRNRGSRDDPSRGVNRYIKRIRHGNRAPALDISGRRPRFLTDAWIQNVGWMFEIVFDYGEHDPAAPRPADRGPWTYRADPFSSCRSGFEVRTTRRCRRVLTFHHFEREPGIGTDCLVRSTDFTYSDELSPPDARNPIHSFIRSITQCGYRRQGDGYLKRTMPPVEFDYSVPIVQGAVQEVDAASLENLPAGLDGTAYQWTRHVSLALLNPVALVQLQTTGTCEFSFPEAPFDLDYPGHYLRRIRSVSVTVPCVTGPYTGVPMRLMLVASRTRVDPGAAGAYPTDPAADDPRFQVETGAVESIAISNGQSDPGLFAADDRDERYLPFERRGAISDWNLTLTSAVETFAWNTITDVVFHLRYTAREGGDLLRAAALTSLNAELAGLPLRRAFSVCSEFPSAWNAFLRPVEGSTAAVLSVDLADRLFPHIAQGADPKITSLELIALVKAPGNWHSTVITVTSGTDVQTPELISSSALYAGQPSTTVAYAGAAPGTWSVSVPIGQLGAPSEWVDDVVLIATYQLELPIA